MRLHHKELGVCIPVAVAVPGDRQQIGSRAFEGQRGSQDHRPECGRHANDRWIFRQGKSDHIIVTRMRHGKQQRTRSAVIRRARDQMIPRRALNLHPELRLAQFDLIIFDRQRKERPARIVRRKHIERIERVDHVGQRRVDGVERAGHCVLASRVRESAQVAQRPLGVIVQRERHRHRMGVVIGDENAGKRPRFGIRRQQQRLHERHRDTRRLVDRRNEHACQAIDRCKAGCIRHGQNKHDFRARTDRKRTGHRLKPQAA